MHTPLISVIIAVYNGELYLPEAIVSILAQTYQNIELIVIDDGSTDGSAQVAARYEVRSISQPNQGLGAALNHGVSLAQGEYLAFLDADDLWVPDKLTIQSAIFAQHPHIEMVFGQMQQFISPELDSETRQRIHCPPDPMPGYSAGTLLIGREDFERVGPFALHWRVGVFTDWYLKASEAGVQELMLPDVLLRRRLHTANIGVTRRGDRSDVLRILKQSLDRRRSGAPE